MTGTLLRARGPDRRPARAGYERETGERIDEERWLLYQLVRLWDEQRAAGQHEQPWPPGPLTSPSTPALLRGDLFRWRVGAR